MAKFVPMDPSQREAQVSAEASNVNKTLHATSHGDMNAGIPWYHSAHAEARVMASGHPQDGPIAGYIRSEGMRASTRPNRLDQDAANYHPGVPATDSKLNPHQFAYHDKVARAAGVLGALSPSQDWEKNKDQGHEIHNGSVTPQLEHDIRTNAKDPARQAAKDEATAKGKASARTMSTRPVLTRGYTGPEGLPESIPDSRKLALNGQSNENIVKALDIHQGKADPTETLRGAGTPDRVKVGSFYDNILNPWQSDSVTNDGRGTDIAEGNNRAWGENRGIGKTQKGIENYRIHEEAYNRNTPDVGAYMRSSHFTAISDADKAQLGREGNLQPRGHMVQAPTWTGDKKADLDFQSDAKAKAAARKQSGSTAGSNARSLRPHPLGQGTGDKPAW
jgi:hypothetical protein